MEKRLKLYLTTMDKVLEMMEEGASKADPETLLQEHLVQISFFSHERLIHLIVTALFAVLEMLALFMSLVTCNIAAIVLAVALLVLLVPYVRHYYILENGVQAMYVQYDRLLVLKGAKKKK